MLGEGQQCVSVVHPLLGAQHALKSTTQLACEARKSFPHVGAGSFLFHDSASFHNQYQYKNKSFISFP